MGAETLKPSHCDLVPGLLCQTARVGGGGWWWCISLEVVAVTGVAFANASGGKGVWGRKPKTKRKGSGLGCGCAASAGMVEGGGYTHLLIHTLQWCPNPTLPSLLALNPSLRPKSGGPKASCLVLMEWEAGESKHNDCHVCRSFKLRSFLVRHLGED